MLKTLHAHDTPPRLTSVGQPGRPTVSASEIRTVAAAIAVLGRQPAEPAPADKVGRSNSG